MASKIVSPTPEALLQNYKEIIGGGTPEDFREILPEKNLCTLISVGKLFEDREAIAVDFLGLLRKAYTDIKLVEESSEIRMINGETALIIFGYHTECHKRDTGEPYGIKGLETQVAIREQGSWKLAHVHYSKVEGWNWNEQM